MGGFDVVDRRPREIQASEAVRLEQSGNPKGPQYTATARGFDYDVWAPGMNKLPPLTLFRNGQMEKADDPYVDLALAREAAACIDQHQSAPWYL